MSTNKSSVRRSLIVSATALVLTVAMLIGTTFAWFTDSVSSGKNTIKSGNLDVVLQHWTGTAWEEVDANTSLFTDVENGTDNLWEPGHTEVAYLKVSNNGSLALKYKLALNIVDNILGKSVNDGNPKIDLTQYLRAGIVEVNGETAPYADRKAAQAAAGSASLTNILRTGTLDEKGDTSYFAIVVYMPESIGNEANYLTSNATRDVTLSDGTSVTLSENQPFINMGVTLVATQAEKESDTFGTDYDKSADGTPDNKDAWNNNVSITNTIAADEENVLSSDDEGIKITVPANSTTASALTLTKVKTDVNDNITISDGNTAESFEISLKDQDGKAVTAANGSYFTIELQLEPGNTVQNFYHKETRLTKANAITAVDQFIYDSATGILTFSTDDFSPFTVEWLFNGGNGTKSNPYLIATGDQAVEMNNAKGYFKLVNDVVVTDEIYLSGKNFYFDLNGHSVTLEYAATAKPNNGSVLYIGGKGGHLTITDSSDAQTGAVYGSDKTYTNKVTSAVRAGNYGKLDIYGGNFYGRSEGTSCIFVYTSMSSGSKATVHIYGGTFRTATPSGSTYYVLNHQDNATAGCTITVHGGSFYNYNPGVTVVDPVTAKTGTIALAAGATTTESTVGTDTIYTVTSAS